MGRVDAGFVRLVDGCSAEGAVLDYLAPGDFYLEFGA